MRLPLPTRPLGSGNLAVPPRGRFELLVQAVALFLLYASPATAGSAAGVPEEQVRAVASQLRCVVCQNLSVADSPSEMANQMRGIIRERLAAGERPEQVVAYFVEKYGEWILLSPRRQGFNLLVWTVPFAALAAGLLAIALLTVKWSRRVRPALTTEPVDPALRERIAKELADLDR